MFICTNEQTLIGANESICYNKQTLNGINTSICYDEETIITANNISYCKIHFRYTIICTEL